MFERMKATDSFSKNPVGEAVGKNFKTFLIAVGLKLSEVSWVYMLTVFVVVYATTTLELPKQMLLDAVMYAALFELTHVADIRLAVGQDRPSAVLHNGRDLHDRLRIPAVLDAGDQERCHGDDAPSSSR